MTASSAAPKLPPGTVDHDDEDPDLGFVDDLFREDDQAAAPVPGHPNPSPDEPAPTEPPDPDREPDEPDDSERRKPGRDPVASRRRRPPDRDADKPPDNGIVRPFDGITSRKI